MTVLLPLLTLAVTDHLQWAPYAAFGAFGSVFAREHGHRRRGRVQVEVGLSLVLAVTLGAAVATTPWRPWLAVVVGAVIAAAAAFASDVLDWRPRGPLFQVFGFGVCAAIPTTPSQVVVAAAVSTASAAVAVAVGTAGALRPTASWRLDDAGTPARQRLRTAWGRPGVRTHLLRYSLAALLAGSLATVSGLGHTAWAVVAAVVPMAAADTRGRLVRATHRFVGTAAGLVLTLALLSLPVRGTTAVLLVAALQVGAELVVLRNYGLAMVLVTPLAVLMGRLTGSVPASRLLVDRAAETAIGLAVGIALTLVLRDREAQEATARSQPRPTTVAADPTTPSRAASHG